jgi:hypothetical protein
MQMGFVIQGRLYMQCLSRQQKEEMSFTSTLNGSVVMYLSLRLASFVPRSARWVLPPNVADMDAKRQKLRRSGARV